MMEKKQPIAMTAKSLKIDKSVLTYWLKKRGYSMSIPHELPSQSNDPMVLQARIRELESQVKRVGPNATF